MRALSVALMFLVLTTSILAGASSTYAESSNDPQVIAETLAENAKVSDESAQSYWDSLTVEQQEAVSELMAEVVIVSSDSNVIVSEAYSSTQLNPEDMSLMAVQCRNAYSNAHFTWAGIFGGAVSQSVHFCWDASGRGIVTSVSCSAGHDQLWPWAFTGYAGSPCTLTTGGAGSQHASFTTEGIFISTMNTSAYPCTGLTVDGFGNASQYNC